MDNKFKSASDSFADTIVPKKIANKNFKAKNKALLTLIDKTYSKVNAPEIVKNFKSNDKNVLAAIAIACQRAKAVTLGQKISNAMQTQATLDAEFASHYNQALDDINNKYIYANSPNSYNSDEALKKLDNKVVKKKKKSAKEPKIVESSQGCEKKSCTLKNFKLFITPKNESFKDLVVEACERSSAKLINEKLDNALPITAKDGDELIVNLITSSKGKDEYHIVGGHLTQFQTNVKIAVEGKCGYGSAPKCPSIELASKDQSFSTLDLLMFKGSEKQHVFENTDTRLSKLRLNPKKTDELGTIRSVNRVIRLLRPPQNPNYAVYKLNLTSCENSGEFHYEDFSPSIIVHPQNVQKVSFSVTYDPNKNRLTPSISYTARQDKDFQNLQVNAEELAKNAKQIITDFCGYDGIIGAIDKASKLYRKFAMLGTTDQLTDETDEQSCTPVDDSSEEVPLLSNKSADFLPPTINVSYFRKKVNLPDKNFAEIGYDQTFFISGSPLFKYEKEVDLLNFFWRKSQRYAVAAATAGFSEIALWASNKLDLTETIENSFSNYIILMKNSVVKYHKEAQANKALTQEELLNEYSTNELGEQVDDADVCEHLATKKEKTKAVKASCVLKFSAAAETDDPNAGLLFSKAAGDKKFTYESTTMYAGINASLEGTLSVNLQILKAVGFSNKVTDGTEAGLKGQVTSADKTGESRFGVTLGHMTPTDSDTKTSCYQLFYSGLNVQIEAFIWYTKSSTYGELNNQEISESKQTATPGRRGRANTETKKLGTIKAQKSLIDFCVFKSSDDKDWKKRPIKSLFKATGDCEATPA